MTRQMTVGDLMTHKVVRVRVDTPYRAIVDALVESRISAVPVVDDARRVVGIVSEADLLHRVEFLGQQHERRVFERPSRHEARAKSQGMLARDLMTSPAVTITADTPVVRAAKIMASAKVKRLPVVDASGALVGIVARSDLLMMYVRPDWAVREDVVTSVVSGDMWLDPAELAVQVTDGVVTLSGTVDRRSTAAILVRLVEAVPGVLEVVNRLAWTHDDTDEAGSRFYRSHPFSATSRQPQ